LIFRRRRKSTKAVIPQYHPAPQRRCWQRLACSTINDAETHAPLYSPNQTRQALLPQSCGQERRTSGGPVEIYRTIRAHQESNDEMIGNNDLWIAALAWEAQLTLVTNMKRNSGCGCAA